MGTRRTFCTRYLFVSAMLGWPFSTITAAEQQDTSAIGADASPNPQVNEGKPLADKSVELEAVVVVAQRVEENIQRVPIAITAVSEQTLERSQITTIAGLQALVPSMTVSPSHDGDADTAYISIRGQVLDQQLITYDPSIGVYQDGVNIGRSTGALLNLIDDQRVEVLRGPQGTLFGRNTTGGAINIIANEPNDKLDGSIGVRFGNYALREGTAIINVPMLDNQVEGRVVYQHSDHNGFGQSVIFDPERIGDSSLDFIRGALRIAPSGIDRLSLLLSADYTHHDTNGSLWYLKQVNPNSLVTFPAGLCRSMPGLPYCPAGSPSLQSLLPYNTNYDSTQAGPEFSKLTTWGGSAILTAELADNVHFKSITARRHVENKLAADTDGTPYYLIAETADGLRQWQWSEEAQLYGKAYDGRFSWFTGYFFFTENGTDLEGALFLAPLSADRSVYDVVANNKSNAIYTQESFEVVPDVHINAGVRYTKDERYATLNNFLVNSLNNAIVGCNMSDFATNPERFDAGANRLQCPVSRQVSYDYGSFSVGPEWQVKDNVFLYAKAAKSSRSGGFNALVPSSLGFVPFSPETVTSYELGTKLDLLERRWRLNAAIYWVDYKNVQAQVVGVLPDGASFGLIQNAAKAHQYGAELESVAQVTKNLRISGVLGVNGSVYDDYRDPATGANLSRTPFPYVSKVTATLSGDYDLPVVWGDSPTLHADYGWRSYYYTGTSAYSYVPSYGLLNASLTIRPPLKGLELVLWARNLADKKYSTVFDEYQALGYTAGIYGEPRTWGVASNMHF